MSFSHAFDWARRHVEAGRMPTAVVGIATADGTVALEAFGDATTSDRYPLFSITKPLTGITAARAIERGLLTPETPLTAALPEFGTGRDDLVRLRHLASHESGIADPPLDATRPLRTELLTRGRDFAAGTASRYSTIAYEGIAAMIEHATGQTWDAAVAEWSAEIGSAFDFDFDTAHPIVGAEAAGVDMARFAELRNPGAGMVASAEDLLRLGTALLKIGRGETGGILHPATLAMMLRPLTGDVPRLDPYPYERGQEWGFTWNLRTRAHGLIDRDVYGHAGWAGTEFWVHPTAGIAWVLLTNVVGRPGVDADELDNAIIAGL